MQITSKEHNEMMEHFEKLHRNRRLDREEKNLWHRGIVYCDGEVNSLFISFREGYSLARCVYQ